MSRVRPSFLNTFAAAVVAGFCLSAPTPSYAQTLPSQERMCDPSWQDCRADLLKYIKQETVGIDAAFWFMNDDRY
ncbi:MAG: hypothetical protein ACJ731_13640, partial [Vicinamibacterales bacterium]